MSIIDEIVADESCPECRMIVGYHGIHCIEFRERSRLWAEGWADLAWLWPGLRHAEVRALSPAFPEREHGPGIGTFTGGFGLSHVFITPTIWVRLPEGDTADRVAAAAVASALRPDLDRVALVEATRAMSPAGLHSLLTPSGFGVATRCGDATHRVQITRGRVDQPDHPDTRSSAFDASRPRLRRRRWLETLVATDQVLELDALTVRSAPKNRPTCDEMADRWDRGLMASAVLDLTITPARARSRWPSGLQAAAQVIRTATHLEVLRRLRAASDDHDVVADVLVELGSVAKTPSWGLHKEFSAIYVSIPMDWLWTDPSRRDQ